MQGENVVEGGLVYDGEFGGVGVLASVVGLYGELVNGGEDTFGDDKWQGAQAGASVDLFGFKLAGSYGYNEVGEQTNQFVTAGIGAALGPVNTSVTYGRLIDTNSDFEEATGIGDSALQPGVLGRHRPGARAWCWPATSACSTTTRPVLPTPAPATPAGPRSAGSRSPSDLTHP